MSAIDGLIIREAEQKDAHGIWQVDRLTLNAWSEDSYVREIGSNKASIYFVAEKEDMILGFAGDMAYSGRRAYKTTDRKSVV